MNYRLAITEPLMMSTRRESRLNTSTVKSPSNWCHPDVDAARMPQAQMDVNCGDYVISIGPRYLPLCGGIIG